MPARAPTETSASGTVSASRPVGRAPRARKSLDEGVQLIWPGRQWRTARTARTAQTARTAVSAEGKHGLEGSDPQSHPRTAPRLFDVTGDATQRIVHGDVLDLTSAMTREGLAGTVDLVYVDPPYASDRDYVAESRLDGPADGRVVRTPAYEDTWTSRPGGLGAYLDMLAPRLDALADLLGPKGTIWVHVDWRASYLVRAILDEVLGRDEIGRASCRERVCLAV